MRKNIKNINFLILKITFKIKTLLDETTKIQLVKYKYFNILCNYIKNIQLKCENKTRNILSIFFNFMK